MAPWRDGAGHVVLAVKVEPKSRRPGVQGLAPGVDGPALRLGVTEAAEDGRANRAVCEALAGLLGVAASAVIVTRGAASRRKSLRIAGEAREIIRKLEAICPHG